MERQKVVTRRGLPCSSDPGSFSKVFLQKHECEKGEEEVGGTALGKHVDMAYMTSTPFLQVK